MSNYSDTEFEAIQAVVDRVSSWQDGAPESTVATELRKGLDETGVSVESADIDKLADTIEAEHGEVKASDVLA